MTNNKSAFVLLMGLVFSFSVIGQTELKRANKEYEFSAFNTAIKSYQEVLKKNPGHLEANSKIADCYRHLLQLQEAVKHYQTAMVEVEVDDLYVFQYGLTLQELGRYQAAREIFHNLAAKSPAFYTRAKQFEEACVFALANDEPSIYKVNNEYANTASADFGPAFFNSERLVYSSGRSDIRNRNNRGGSNSDVTNRLFVTQRDKNGFLETPVTLHEGFSSNHNEGPISYSPDGQWAVITKNNFIDGTRQIPSSGLNLSLYLAQVGPDGDFTNSVPFAHNGQGYSTGYGSFSPDGKALYFSSDRPEGYGGYDIYVSYLMGGSWSAPENLGATINSLGNEITPFHDGSSFFFASDYHKGFGGFDIFRAEESKGKWATLYHGGTGLNSSVDDFGFVFDPVRNTGYFVSNRSGGKGAEDIYRVTKETESVVIKVTDAVSGAPVGEAIVDFTACGDGQFRTNSNGVFNFQLVENLNCKAGISKPGYIPMQVSITTLGLRQSRTLTVALMNESQAYSGKTGNAANGYLLDNVKVIATPQPSGEVVETRSDAQGNYYLALKQGVNYVIRYSKAGFRDVSVNFTPSATGTKNFENAELIPVGEEALAASDNNLRAKDGSAATTSATTVNTAIKGISNGFAVQIAATTASDIDLSVYKSKAGTLGNVYSVKEAGRTKVRVGPFASKEEADAAKAKARAMGYDGSFSVEESNKEVLANAATAPQMRAKEAVIITPQPAAATPAATTNNAEVAAATTSSNLSGYLVRLATYKDVNYFDASKVSDIGVVNKVPKGPLTYIILSGYDSRDSAEIALRKAKVRGFPDAFMVVESGGDFVKAN